MKRAKCGFTLIELLVVVSIIALLISILMPALGKARENANMIKCRANLHQWGMAFDMYLQDNRGEFMSGVEDEAAGVYGGWWWAFKDEYVSTEDNTGIWVCPSCALRTPSAPLSWGYRGAPMMNMPPGAFPTAPNMGPGMMPPGDPNMAMVEGEDDVVEEEGPAKLDGLLLTGTGGDYAWEAPGIYAGSYGLNGWLYNRPEGKDLENRGQDVRVTGDKHWRSMDRLRPAGNIPLLAESYWVHGWPTAGDTPPPEESDYDFPEQSDHMQRFCINSHDGRINIVFADGAARPVALKQLWSLAWHVGYTVPETPDWPDWMDNFRDK